MSVHKGAWLYPLKPLCVGLIMEVCPCFVCANLTTMQGIRSWLSPTFLVPFGGWPRRGFFLFDCEIKDLESCLYLAMLWNGNVQYVVLTQILTFCCNCRLRLRRFLVPFLILSPRLWIQYKLLKCVHYYITICSLYYVATSFSINNTHLTCELVAGSRWYPQVAKLSSVDIPYVILLHFFWPVLYKM